MSSKSSDRLGLSLPDDFRDISVPYRPDRYRRILLALPTVVYVLGPITFLFLGLAGVESPTVAVYSFGVLASVFVVFAVAVWREDEGGDSPLMKALKRAFAPTTWDRDPVDSLLRASAMLVRLRWEGMLRAVMDVPPGKELVSPPELLGVDEHPQGLRIWVAVPAGTDAAHVRALEPRLGSLVRRPVSVVASDQSTVVFGVRFRDPLAAPVRVQASSSSAVPGVILGRSEAGEAVRWSPPSDLSHLAIQGQSRAGKSSLLYGVVAQLRARRQLVVGIDPAGNLFKRWPGQSLPSGESTSDLIANGLGDTVQLRGVLEGLLALLDARLAVLAESSGDKFDSDDAAHPPVFVVLDEFAGLVATVKSDDQARSKEDKLSPLLETVKNRLLAEGLKVNLVVVISTQRFDASILGGAARSNIRTRVTLRVDNADAIRMLHDSVPDDLRAAIPGFPPGRGVVEGASDSFELREMRAPFTRYEEYRAVLAGGGPRA